jgi:hypothetical protein
MVKRDNECCGSYDSHFDVWILSEDSCCILIRLKYGLSARRPAGVVGQWGKMLGWGII